MSDERDASSMSGSPTALRRGAKGVVQLTLASGIGSAIAAVATVLVASRLAPAEWGRTATAIAWATLASGAILFGTHTHVVRDLASERRGPRDFLLLWHRLIAACLTGSAAAVVVAVALHSSVAWVSLTCAVAAAMVLRQAATAPPMAASQFLKASAATIVERVVILCAVLLVLAWWGVTSRTYLWAQVAGLSTAVVFLRVRWGPEYRGFSPAGQVLRWAAMWRGSWSFGLVAATAAISQLDIAFVSLLSGDKQAGYFGLASRFIMPLSLLGSAAASVALPLAAQEPGRLMAETYRRRWAMAGALVALAAVLTFLVPPLLIALVGHEYSPALPAVRMYCFATVLVTLNQPMAAVLQALRRERWVSRLLAIAVGIHLLGAAVGSKAAGATGAAFGYAISNVVVTVFCLSQLRRATRELAVGAGDG